MLTARTLPPSCALFCAALKAPALILLTLLVALSGSATAQIQPIDIGMNGGPVQGPLATQVPFADIMKLSAPFWEVDTGSPGSQKSLTTGVFILDVNGYPTNGVPYQAGMGQNAISVELATTTLSGLKKVDHVLGGETSNYPPGTFYVYYTGTPISTTAWAALSGDDDAKRNHGALFFENDDYDVSDISTQPIPQPILPLDELGNWENWRYQITLSGSSSFGIGLRLKRSLISDYTASPIVVQHTRNIRIYHEDDDGVGDGLPDVTSTEYPDNTLFKPEFLSLLGQLNPKCLRMNHWKRVPTAGLNSYADEVGEGFQTWLTTNDKGGVPWSVCVELCRLMNADLWISVPHTVGAAEDSNGLNLYVTSLALEMLGLLNNPSHAGIDIYLEYSNEIWNGQGGKAGPGSWVANEVAGDPITVHGITVDTVAEYYGAASCSIFETFSTVAPLLAGRVHYTLGLWLGQPDWLLNVYGSMTNTSHGLLTDLAVAPYMGSQLMSALLPPDPVDPPWIVLRDTYMTPAEHEDLLQLAEDTVSTSPSPTLDERLIALREMADTTLGIDVGLGAGQVRFIGYESGINLTWEQEDCFSAYSAALCDPPTASCPCTSLDDNELEEMTGFFIVSNRHDEAQNTMGALYSWWGEQSDTALLNAFTFMSYSLPGSWHGTLEFQYGYQMSGLGCNPLTGGVSCSPKAQAILDFNTNP